MVNLQVLVGILISHIRLLRLSRTRRRVTHSRTLSSANLMMNPVSPGSLGLVRATLAKEFGECLVSQLMLELISFCVRVWGMAARKELGVTVGQSTPGQVVQLPPLKLPQPPCNSDFVSGLDSRLGSDFMPFRVPGHRATALPTPPGTPPPHTHTRTRPPSGFIIEIQSGTDRHQKAGKPNQQVANHCGHPKQPKKKKKEKEKWSEEYFIIKRGEGEHLFDFSGYRTSCVGPHKRTSSAINVNVEIFMMQPPSDAFFYFSLFSS